MKPFAFSFERVRGYKSQLLETEKNTLRTLNKQLADIEEKIRLCRLFQQEKREELQEKQVQGALMRDLEECRFYLNNTRLQLEALNQERELAALAAERQRKVVLKASQEVSGLDKLEEKQLDDYHYLEARYNEKVILEQVINQLSSPKESH
jgi:flagellar FliJ protein